MDARERETNYTKVGYSKNDDGKRIRDINKCGVAYHKTYQTLKFPCAYQAEQIIHDILAEWAHERLDCWCRKVNREWYQLSFGSIITTIHWVSTWMMQQPYDLQTQQLKPEWVEALNHWHLTHKTVAPLSWAEFFIVGISHVPQSVQSTSESLPLRRIASTSNISDATSPYIPSQDRAKKKNTQPDQPPPFTHSNSSPATFRSGSPPADKLSRVPVSKSRRPSNRNPASAPSKAVIFGLSRASTRLSGNSSVTKASEPEAKTLGRSNVESHISDEDYVPDNDGTTADERPSEHEDVTGDEDSLKADGTWEDAAVVDVISRKRPVRRILFPETKKPLDDHNSTTRHGEHVPNHPDPSSDDRKWCTTDEKFTEQRPSLSKKLHGRGSRSSLPRLCKRASQSPSPFT